MKSVYILALTLLPGCGRKSIRELIAKFPEGSTNRYNFKYLLRDKYKADEIDKAITKAENIIVESESQNIYSITPFDFTFPEYLLNIPDSPVLIFYRGDISLIESGIRVAVVGTRNPSVEGTREGVYITERIIENRITVVSGLAKGIDAIAHQTCIKNHGRTVACLPSSIDRIYPNSNMRLSEEIVDSGGLLISEYPIGSVLNKCSFIERDRLQSGLSQGIIVIETEIKGGTMHTVKHGISQGRILGCVEYPNITFINQGNHELIKSGKAVSINHENLVDFIELAKGDTF